MSNRLESLSTTLTNGTFDVLAPINNTSFITVVDTHFGNLIEPRASGDFSYANLYYNYVTVPQPPITSTSIISGNIKKLNLPFVAQIVAVSIGIDPVVVGTTTSDLSGNYSMDIAPHEDEVVLYAVQDYGLDYIAGAFTSLRDIYHPSTPNGFVYHVVSDGNLGIAEPVWSTTHKIKSGDVVLKPEILHKPLANGFAKPLVTPL